MDENFLFLGRMGVSESTLEKISLSELTSLVIESEPEVFIVAALSMRDLLGQEKVVNLIIFEVALTILL